MSRFRKTAAVHSFVGFAVPAAFATNDACEVERSFKVLRQIIRPRHARGMRRITACCDRVDARDRFDCVEHCSTGSTDRVQRGSGVCSKRMSFPSSTGQTHLNDAGSQPTPNAGSLAERATNGVSRFQPPQRAGHDDRRSEEETEGDVSAKGVRARTSAGRRTVSADDSRLGPGCAVRHWPSPCFTSGVHGPVACGRPANISKTYRGEAAGSDRLCGWSVPTGIGINAG
jgi:hypothetical protein